MFENSRVDNDTEWEKEVSFNDYHAFKQNDDALDKYVDDHVIIKNAKTKSEDERNQHDNGETVTKNESGAQNDKFRKQNMDKVDSCDMSSEDSDTEDADDVSLDMASDVETGINIDDLFGAERF